MAMGSECRSGGLKGAAARAHPRAQEGGALCPFPPPRPTTGAEKTLFFGGFWHRRKQERHSPEFMDFKQFGRADFFGAIHWK